MLYFSFNWWWNKKNGLNEPFWTSFLPISKKLSALDEAQLFRSPNIVLDTKSSILVQWCSFLIGMLYFSHNWRWNYKIGLTGPFWTSFYLFPKKYPNFFDHRTLFWWPKSSILVQLCSFLMGRLQFSQNWEWNKKKMEWANYFSQVFNYFQKSIRARWGLTLSITEHYFGH